MKERVRKILSGLASPADAVVFVNSTEPHVDQSFFYVFDCPSGIFEGSVAIARPDGSLDLLSSQLEEESARQAAKRDPSVRISVMAKPDDRKKWVADQLADAKQIALNFHELTHEDFRFLETQLPKASWSDATPAIRKARLIKDAAEIERIGRAGALGSKAALEIPGLLKEGITEIELASEIEYRMNRAGATGRSFSTIVGFGAHGAEPHYSPKETRLERGQSIVCDFGCLHERYASDITRSFRFAPGDAEMKKVHETVQEAQSAALAVIKDGVPGKEAHRAAAKVVDASPWKGRFIHGLGHSVGLAVHDGYGMGPATDEPLRAGMVVTVEPGVFYLPGKGGVRIEDDIVVTESGYRFLTTAPREYIEVGAWSYRVSTGGGDCPGLNAAIRGAVYPAGGYGDETIGFLDGWKGARDGLTMPLDAAALAHVGMRGGTLLGSSRTNPFAKEADSTKLLATLDRERIGGLVAIGGDDTLTAARELHRRGRTVVGVPKTMDNDVGGTDWTFGFDSASTVATDALERLRDTATSHHRAIVLEVMGRHAGWVALATGLAGAADATLLPEEPYDEAALLAHVRSAVAARGAAVIVVSEGVDLGTSKGSAGGKDEFGHELLRERGVGAEVARRIEAATGIETRSAQIGHIQRGGPPTLFDRILATRLGAKAVDLLHDGRGGTVAVLRGERVEGVPLDEALRAPKVVDAAWLDLLHTFDA